MLTTGTQVPLENAEDFQNGMKFEQTQFDDVFGGLVGADQQFAAEIHDHSSGRTIRLKFDKTFEYCVVYNPGHREAICVEPYTCIPDAINLVQQNISAGLRILAPGDVFKACFSIEVT